MTTFLRIAGFMLLLGSCGFAQAAQMALVPGDPVPEIRGNTVDGTRVVSDYSANQITLINFFATWCEPCREEMPMLQELFRERAADGLKIVGVLQESIDDEALTAFIDSSGVTYPLIRPRGDDPTRFGGVSILPSSFLVDNRGRLLQRYVGATPEQIEGMRADIVAALEGRPLGRLVMPETPNAVSVDDKPKAPQP